MKYVIPGLGPTEAEIMEALLGGATVKMSPACATLNGAQAMQPEVEQHRLIL
jgi:hypothetical protein